MSLRINTKYREVLTSRGLNEKVSDILGGNALISGFEVTKHNNTNVKIKPGICVIGGAIIEETSTEKILTAHQNKYVVLRYNHKAETLEYLSVSVVADDDLVIASITSSNNIISSITMTPYTKTLSEILERVHSLKEEFTKSKDEKFIGDGFITIDNSIHGACDVNIKGKTLINLIPKCELIWDGAAGIRYNTWKQTPSIIKPTKHSTDYTLIVNVKENNLNLNGTPFTDSIFGHLRSVTGMNNINISIPPGFKGMFIKKVTSSSSGGHPSLNQAAWDINGQTAQGEVRINGGRLVLTDIMLLEGDWTDKEIPKYFEGLQGVGSELISNNKKMELLSSHHSIFPRFDDAINKFDLNSARINGDKIQLIHTHDCFVKTRKKYTIKQNEVLYCIMNYATYYSNAVNYGVNLFIDRKVAGKTGRVVWNEIQAKGYCLLQYKHTSPEDLVCTIGITAYYGDYDVVGFGIAPNEEAIASILELNKTSYQLNKPLHALPNGICDEITAHGELIKRTDSVVLDGTQQYGITFQNDNYIGFFVNNMLQGVDHDQHSLICDKFNSQGYATTNSEGIMRSGSYWVEFCILKSRLTQHNVAGVVEWLKKNPVTVVAAISRPTTTQLNSVQKLHTFDGTTYISVNTTIKPTITIDAPANIGSTIRRAANRLNQLEDLIDGVILPGIIDVDYRRELFGFQFNYSRNKK